MIQSAEQIAQEAIDHEFMIQEIMAEITEDINLIDLFPGRYQDPEEQIMELFA